MKKQFTRRRSKNTATQHTFEVRWSGPLNIPASLEIFRRWGDDLIDRWNGRVLVRTTRVGKQTVPFACTIVGTIEKPAAEVTVEGPDHAPPVEHVVKGMFITAPEALTELAATDSVIAGLEERYRGVRPVLQSDLMTALIRSISAQQVNLTWATTTRRRLAEAFGRQHTLGAHLVMSLESDRLATASVAELRALQFTTRKAEYITALASAIEEGACDLMTLREQSDAEVIRRLTHFRGIGRWSAEWFLARALGRPCVAAGDLGVRKAIGAAYLQGRLPSEAEVRELTAHWGEAAGVAQQLILHALSHGWE